MTNLSVSDRRADLEATLKTSVFRSDFDTLPPGYQHDLVVVLDRADEFWAPVIRMAMAARLGRRDLRTLDGPPPICYEVAKRLPGDRPLWTRLAEVLARWGRYP